MNESQIGWKVMTTEKENAKHSFGKSTFYITSKVMSGK